MLGVDAPAAQAPRCLCQPHAWLCEDRWDSECHLLVFNIRGLGFCFWGIRAQCVTIHARPAEQHVTAVDVGLPSVSAKVSQFFTVGKSMHHRARAAAKCHTFSHSNQTSHIFTHFHAATTQSHHPHSRQVLPPKRNRNLGQYNAWNARVTRHTPHL